MLIFKNHYFVQARSLDSYQDYDISCCEKLICFPTSYFNIKCKHCSNIIYNYSPTNNESDIGWNSIEGKEKINIICFHCNNENTLNLTTNNDCLSCHTLGKRIYNQNRYILQDGARLIIQ